MKHVSLWFGKNGGRFDGSAVYSFNLSENPEHLVVVAGNRTRCRRIPREAVSTAEGSGRSA
ncbi:MAG: hypothetical protein AVO39_03230 [delta proteobacterium MLS_D]|jgi:hypothetical protein|nr:MAG: hypothetical protein AVO39_03230 [delta proteobacterium MLS_D]